MAEILHMPVTTELDDLAGRARAGIDRMKKAEDDWCDGALETCRALSAARRMFPADRAFSKWCDTNGLGSEKLSKNDRAAYIGMGDRIDRAEKILRTTKSRSIRLIYQKDFRFPSDGKPDEPGTIEQSPEPRQAKPRAASKLTPELRERIEAKLKQGMAQPQIVEEINAALPKGQSISIQVVKMAAAAFRAAEPDPSELSTTAKAKLERAMRAARVEIRAEVEVEISERKRRWFDEIYLRDIAEREAAANQIIAKHKGLMPRSTYRKILACLHPDNADEARKDRFSEAFQAIRELEAVLVKVEDEKRPGRPSAPRPKSWAEMMAQRTGKRR